MTMIYDNPSMTMLELTTAQEETREAFKAFAAELFTGARFVRAREALKASGLNHDTAEETLCDAVVELIENGWDL